MIKTPRIIIIVPIILYFVCFSFIKIDAIKIVNNELVLIIGDI